MPYNKYKLSDSDYAFYMKDVPKFLREKTSFPRRLRRWKIAQAMRKKEANTARLEKRKSLNHFVKTSFWDAPDAKDLVGRLRQHAWRTRNLQFAKKWARALTLDGSRKRVLVKRHFNPNFLYHLHDKVY